jgi:hypothetical protein
MVNSLVSLVIDDFHVMGITVNSSEADTPLIVDPDAVLAFATTLRRLESVGWRNSQITQHRGVAEHTQLATCNGLDIDRQSSRRRSDPVLSQISAIRS